MSLASLSILSRRAAGARLRQLRCVSTTLYISPLSPSSTASDVAAALTAYRLRVLSARVLATPPPSKALALAAGRAALVRIESEDEERMLDVKNALGMMAERDLKDGGKPGGVMRRIGWERAEKSVKDFERNRMWHVTKETPLLLGNLPPSITTPLALLEFLASRPRTADVEINFSSFSSIPETHRIATLTVSGEADADRIWELDGEMVEGHELCVLKVR